MPPLAAGAHEVEQPVQQASHIRCPRPSPRLGGRDQRLQNPELIIGQCLAGPEIPDQRAIREALGARHGIAPETIVAGAGSDEIIDLLFRAFVEPGDRVVIASPTFGMYAFDAELQGADGDEATALLTRRVIDPIYRTVLIPAFGLFGVTFGLWYVGLV